MELSEKLSGKTNGLSKKRHFEKKSMVGQRLLQSKKSASHICITPQKKKDVVTIKANVNQHQCGAS